MSDNEFSDDELYWVNAAERRAADTKYFIEKLLSSKKKAFLLGGKNANAIVRLREAISNLQTKMAQLDDALSLEDRFNALIAAVEQQDDKLLADLLKNGANPNESEKCVAGRRVSETPTPLLVAAASGYLTGCRILLNHGANPDTAYEGQSPILKACYGGQSRIMKVLLDHGADPDAAYKNGCSLLHQAVRSCNYDLCKLLIDNDADVNAVAGSLYPIVEAGCGNVSVLGTLAYRDCLASSCKRIYKMLIRAGAQVNLLDKEGGLRSFSPLMIAVRRNDTELCKLLVEDGAIIGPPLVGDGWRLLWTAAKFGNADICRMLIGIGADVNLQLKGVYETALYAAVKSGNAECCRVLIQAGASIHTKCGTEQMSSLKLAATSGNSVICDVMLQEGGPISPLLRQDVAAWLHSSTATTK